MNGVRTTVAVLLTSLALVPCSASAECAWVLWTKIDDEPWRIVEAHATREPCIVGLKKVTAPFEAFPNPRGQKVDVLAATFSTIERGEQGRMVNHFGKCLPDTIDPREPKAR